MKTPLPSFMQVVLKHCGCAMSHIYTRLFILVLFICSLITIHHCHLVIINAYPNNSESLVTGHPPRDVSITFNILF